MKLSKHKSARSLAFNMTPMIDIVFLLIIFFMTVSQITGSADIPLPLPRVTIGDTNAQTSSITLNLDREGSLIFRGKRMPINTALNMIKLHLAKVDDDPNRIKIQIRCDRLCECRHVSELLESLSNLGFTHVRSAVSDS